MDIGEVRSSSPLESTGKTISWSVPMDIGEVRGSSPLESTVKTINWSVPMDIGEVRSSILLRSTYVTGQKKHFRISVSRRKMLGIGFGGSSNDKKVGKRKPDCAGRQWLY